MSAAAEASGAAGGGGARSRATTLGFGAVLIIALAAQVVTTLTVDEPLGWFLDAVWGAAVLAAAVGLVSRLPILTLGGAALALWPAVEGWAVWKNVQPSDAFRLDLAAVLVVYPVIALAMLGYAVVAIVRRW